MRTQGRGYASARQDAVCSDRRLNNIIPPPPPPPARESERNVSIVEIALKPSALDGVKVREVTATTAEEAVDLRHFVNPIKEVDRRDSLESNSSNESDEEDDNEDAAPVMAGERARGFSDLPPEFDGEPGPLSRRRRTTYAAEDEQEEEETPGRPKAKAKVPGGYWKPI